MQTILGLLPYVVAIIHLMPSVAMPYGVPSALIAPMSFSDASLRGWLAAVMAMTRSGVCSSSSRMSVTSVYPSVRTIGATSTLAVRNWGPSCVVTPLLGGADAPEMTIAEILLPRTESISETARPIVSTTSVSDATMGFRFRRSVYERCRGS